MCIWAILLLQLAKADKEITEEGIIGNCKYGKTMLTNIFSISSTKM